MSTKKTSDSLQVDVVYWALNGYGVTMVDIAVNCCMGILSFFIVFLNSLVLDTMIRRQSQVEVLNVMVSSLASADLINGLCLLYHLVYNMTNFQIYEECLIRLSLIHLLVIASVYHLTLLTFDRYFKIMKPLVYRQLFTKTHTIIGCLVIWFFSLMLALLPAMGWALDAPVNKNKSGNQSQSESNPVCSYFGLLHPDYLRLLMSLALAPLIIMIILYCIIFRVAHRHAKQIAAQSMAIAPEQRKDRHTWRYTKTVMIIMGLYFICWSPSGAVILLVTSGELSHLSVIGQGTILSYASLLAFVNSVVNPVVYAIQLTTVRARFKAIFCCGERKKNAQKNQSLVFKEGISVIKMNGHNTSPNATNDIKGIRFEMQESS